MRAAQGGKAALRFLMCFLLIRKCSEQSVFKRTGTFKPALEG